MDSFSSKQNEKKQPITNDLLESAANKYKLAVPLEFIRFLGSLEAAAFLAQLLYWHPKADDPNNWIYKTDAQWAKELGISQYQVREQRKLFEVMGLIETKVCRAMNGSPTVHYRCNVTRIKEVWASFIGATTQSWLEVMAAFKKEARTSRKPEVGKTGVQKSAA